MRKTASGDREHRSIRSPGLVEETYSLILEQLISLKIAPGARITVDDLARQFGISQTPIREALGRLERDGLVTKTHLVGYRATPQLTRNQFENLYEVRTLLEPVAARHAASRIEPRELEALKQFTEEMRQQIASGNHVSYGHFALHDADFHARIAHASGNDLIADTLSRLHAHVHIFRLFFHSRVTESALVEHESIIDAIAARDPERAQQAMHAHIEESWKRLKQGF